MSQDALGKSLVGRSFRAKFGLLELSYDEDKIYIVFFPFFSGFPGFR